MIKTYCDICGKEIKNDDYIIAVNIGREPKDLKYDSKFVRICPDCESKFMNIYLERKDKKWIWEILRRLKRTSLDTDC